MPSYATASSSANTTTESAPEPLDWLWLVVGGDVGYLLGQKDAVAEKGESCASVHLSHDPFSAGVDAFGAAVVVGQSKGGVHSGPVDFQAVGEAAQMRWSTARAAAIHSVSFTSLPAAGVSRAAKPRTRLASAVISGQAAEIFSSTVVSFGCRLSGLVSRRRPA